MKLGFISLLELDRFNTYEQIVVSIGYVKKINGKLKESDYELKEEIIGKLISGLKKANQ